MDRLYLVVRELSSEPLPLVIAAWDFKDDPQRIRRAAEYLETVRNRKI